MEIPTKDAPLEATPTALKSILWAWAGVINSHMSMPALRRLREDAGESPPKFGQKNSFFKSASATESIYREWECFSKGGKEAPPKGDSDSL